MHRITKETCKDAVAGKVPGRCVPRDRAIASHPGKSSRGLKGAPRSNPPCTYNGKSSFWFKVFWTSPGQLLTVCERQSPACQRLCLSMPGCECRSAVHKPVDQHPVPPAGRVAIFSCHGLQQPASHVVSGWRQVHNCLFLFFARVPQPGNRPNN
jgi:hypothetical protein